MSDKIISPDRTPCTYGNRCYRTNPEHLKKYTHRKLFFTNNIIDVINTITIDCGVGLSNSFAITK